MSMATFRNEIVGGFVISILSLSKSEKPSVNILNIGSLTNISMRLANATIMPTTLIPLKYTFST